jgi:hypothetical protein
MLRACVLLLVGAALCWGGSAPAADDQGKTHEIKGGIDGKIKSVDADAKTLTIVTDQGSQRTFKITDETIMLGPRGGKVRRHLKDPRFHKGFSVTIVAQGDTATEVHLGFARAGDEGKTAPAKVTKSGTQEPTRDEGTDQPKTARRITRPAPRTEAPTQPADDQTATKTVAKGRTAKYAPAEDEDHEVPGKVKSFDPAKRILVISLLNGKDRSFMLSRDVKVLVKGTASRQGLQDPALKTGAKITVTTDEDGRKVKELEIVPASPIRSRKAG